MSSQKLSVTIITLNEQANIGRCLDSLSFADEVIVVDSGSTDRTLQIAKEKGAKVFTNDWKGYGQQKNYAHAQASGPWILNLDADEVVSADLAKEIKEAIQRSEFSGYRIPRKTRFLGRWIMHGGWYPNYLVRLSLKDRSSWTEPKIHEELKVEGPVGRLLNDLEHYTFDGIEDQVLANLKYAKLGSEELKLKNKRPSLFRQILKPWGKFIETYLLKRGFLDGWPGFVISVNAAYSIFLKYTFQIEDHNQ